jgi:hypothetical protein
MYYLDEQLEQFNKKNDQINSYINTFLLNKEKNLINDISDLKINDIVHINFIPDSQKYINDLFPKFGKIMFIENNQIIIENLDKVYEELLHDGVSYIGQSLGYSYYIYKFI